MSDFLHAIARQANPEHFYDIVRPANPVAGAGFVVPVPGDRAWRVRGIGFKLTASAAVANRVPVLTFGTDVAVYAATAANVATTAGLVTTYTWLRDLSPVTVPLVAGIAVASLGDVTLPPGHTITCAIGAIDVADQISAIALYVEAAFVFPEGVHQIREATYAARVAEGIEAAREGGE